MYFTKGSYFGLKSQFSCEYDWHELAINSGVEVEKMTMSYREFRVKQINFL